MCDDIKIQIVKIVTELKNPKFLQNSKNLNCDKPQKLKILTKLQ